MYVLCWSKPSRRSTGNQTIFSLHGGEFFSSQQIYHLLNGKQDSVTHNCGKTSLCFCAFHIRYITVRKNFIYLYRSTWYCTRSDTRWVCITSRWGQIATRMWKFCMKTLMRLCIDSLIKSSQKKKTRSPSHTTIIASCIILNL